MKRAFAALLLLLLMTAVCACSYILKPDDEEVREAVKKLLPDAYTATYLIYGPGVELDPDNEIDPSWTQPHYIPVSPDSPYQTENDIRKVTLCAFSRDYADDMFEYAFINNDLVMSRYTEYAGRLAMDVVRKKPLQMAKEFYPDTLRVVKGNSYACKADIECLLANDQKATVTLSLVKEDGEWRFDGPVY